MVNTMTPGDYVVTIGAMLIALGCIPLLYTRFHRVGGLLFFRIGRFGGSFYISRVAKESRQ